VTSAAISLAALPCLSALTTDLDLDRPPSALATFPITPPTSARPPLKSHFLLPIASVMAAAAEQGSQQALCLLAHGSEELEYATIFDLLTRAGVQVVTASVGLQEGEKFVRCSRGLRIVPDGRLEDLPVRLSSSSSELVRQPS
jgi:hypothetical protein